MKDQVVVNDRWGRGTTCIHGDFINCHDRYNPGKSFLLLRGAEVTVLVIRETAAEEVGERHDPRQRVVGVQAQRPAFRLPLSTRASHCSCPDHKLWRLVASCLFGTHIFWQYTFTGNLLINLGPTKEGTIAPIFQDRLTQLGDWLRINGEAIYNSRPWIAQNDTVNPQVWSVRGKFTKLLLNL